MIARPLRALLFVSLLAALLPFRAEAHSSASTLIHGTVLLNAKAVDGETGNCSCETKWYTSGLRPGKVTVVLHLRSVALKLGASYGLRADLERRNHTILNQTQGGCWSTSKHCSLTLRFTAKVFHAAPYYIHVSGEGAEGMVYSIQVLGAIYRVS